MSETETAVLLMSDLHYGKETVSFDPNIARDRLKRLGEKLASIRRRLGPKTLDGLVVCMLGDMNDGSAIYATQPYHQAITNVERQADELSATLAEWLQVQRKLWGTVRVEAVPGNHGRVAGAHEAANWDIVLYRYLMHRLGDDIPFGMNEESDPFVRVIKIGQHKMLLFHGDTVRMYMQIPWYGLHQRLMRWYTGKWGPFAVAACGHFHSCGSWQLNKFRLFMAGTMVSDDEWARRTIGLEGTQRWWLFGVTPKRPVAWAFDLDLC